MKVFIVSFRYWPEAGIKAVCTSRERAQDAIDLYVTHGKMRAMAGKRVPFDREGFDVNEVEADVAIVNGSEWNLGMPDGPLRIRQGG